MVQLQTDVILEKQWKMAWCVFADFPYQEMQVTFGHEHIAAGMKYEFFRRL